MSKRTISLFLATALLLATPALAGERDDWQLGDLTAQLFQEIHSVLSWLASEALDPLGSGQQEIDYAKSTASDDPDPTTAPTSEDMTNPTDGAGDEVGGFIEPIG